MSLKKLMLPLAGSSTCCGRENPNGDISICPVEETLQEISEATGFSKRGLNMAFHQIELHPDSRDNATFAAPDGLYRYKRLLFGVNMATEEFQQLIWQILKDCPGAYNLYDDVRVVGGDHKEHDENLDKVMCKFEEHGGGGGGCRYRRRE